MFLLLEALFIAIAFLGFALWLSGAATEERGRKRQIVALLAALVLLYPCISLADDYREQQQPLDVPASGYSLVKHVPIALSASPVALPVTTVSRTFENKLVTGVAADCYGGLAPRVNTIASGLRAPPQQ